MPQSDNGFSSIDRETLTTVKVELSFLVQRVGESLARIAKLEETRLTARDLEELMSDTDTLRKEKSDLEKRVSALEKWQYKIVGASLACGSIAGFAVKVFLR